MLKRLTVLAADCIIYNSGIYELFQAYSEEVMLSGVPIQLFLGWV